MKSATIGILMSAGLCLAAANAQEMLQVRFTATCQSTNDSGNLVKEKITNDSILQNYADQNGITNLSSIALVYGVDADERGDVLEVVDAYTGAVLQQVYGFFFPMDLPTGPDGSRFSRFAYMYNDQQAYEMGSALLSERVKLDKHGDTARKIVGMLQFYLTSDEMHGLRLCSGKLSAGNPFTLTPLPPPPSTNAAPTQVNSRDLNGQR